MAGCIKQYLPDLDGGFGIYKRDRQFVNPPPPFRRPPWLIGGTLLFEVLGVAFYSGSGL